MLYVHVVLEQQTTRRKKAGAHEILRLTMIRHAQRFHIQKYTLGLYTSQQGGRA